MKEISCVCALVLSVTVLGQPNTFTISSIPTINLRLADAATDNFGSIYVLANGGPNDDGIYINKSGFSGNIAWEKQIAESGYYYSAYTIAADTNSVYITGHRISILPPSSPEYFVIRLDTNGQFLWEKFITPGPFSFSESICKVDGSCVVVGAASATTPQYCIAFNIDSLGIVLWSFGDHASPASSGSFAGVTEIPGGNIFICGQTGNSATLTKIDVSGAIIWKEYHTWPGASTGFSSCTYNGTGIYATGMLYIQSSSSPMQQVLAILDTSGGSNLMKRVTDSVSNYVPTSITRTSSNTYLVCGNYGQNSFVYEYDANLNFIRGILEPIYSIQTALRYNNTTAVLGGDYQGNNITSDLYLDSTWTPGCSAIRDTVMPLTISLPSGTLSSVYDTLSFQPGICSTTTVSTSRVICSTSVGIEQVSMSHNAKLFPNPSNNGEVTLEFSEPTQADLIITIVNSIGVTLLQIPISSGTKTVQINIDPLSSGTYFLLQDNLNPLCLMVIKD